MTMDEETISTLEYAKKELHVLLFAHALGLYSKGAMKCQSRFPKLDKEKEKKRGDPWFNPFDLENAILIFKHTSWTADLMTITPGSINFTGSESCIPPFSPHDRPQDRSDREKNLRKSQDVDPGIEYSAPALRLTASQLAKQLQTQTKNKVTTEIFDRKRFKQILIIDILFFLSHFKSEKDIFQALVHALSTSTVKNLQNAFSCSDDGEGLAESIMGCVCELAYEVFGRLLLGTMSKPAKDSAGSKKNQASLIDDTIKRSSGLNIPLVFLDSLLTKFSIIEDGIGSCSTFRNSFASLPADSPLLPINLNELITMNFAKSLFKFRDSNRFKTLQPFITQSDHTKDFGLMLAMLLFRTASQRRTLVIAESRQSAHKNLELSTQELQGQFAQSVQDFGNYLLICENEALILDAIKILWKFVEPRVQKFLFEPTKADDSQGNGNHSAPTAIDPLDLLILDIMVKAFDGVSLDPHFNVLVLSQTALVHESLAHFPAAVSTYYDVLSRLDHFRELGLGDDDDLNCMHIDAFVGLYRSRLKKEYYESLDDRTSHENEFRDLHHKILPKKIIKTQPPTEDRIKRFCGSNSGLAAIFLLVNASCGYNFDTAERLEYLQHAATHLEKARLDNLQSHHHQGNAPTVIRRTSTSITLMPSLVPGGAFFQAFCRAVKDRKCAINDVEYAGTGELVGVSNDQDLTTIILRDLSPHQKYYIAVAAYDKAGNSLGTISDSSEPILCSFVLSRAHIWTYIANFAFTLQRDGPIFLNAYQTLWSIFLESAPTQNSIANYKKPAPIVKMKKDKIAETSSATLRGVIQAIYEATDNDVENLRGLLSRTDAQGQVSIANTQLLRMKCATNIVAALELSNAIKDEKLAITSVSRCVLAILSIIDAAPKIPYLQEILRVCYKGFVTSFDAVSKDGKGSFLNIYPILTYHYVQCLTQSGLTVEAAEIADEAMRFIAKQAKGYSLDLRDLCMLDSSGMEAQWFVATADDDVHEKRRRKNAWGECMYAVQLSLGAHKFVYQKLTTMETLVEYLDSLTPLNKDIELKKGLDRSTTIKEFQYALATMAIDSLWTELSKYRKSPRYLSLCLVRSYLRRALHETAF